MTLFSISAAALVLLPAFIDPAGSPTAAELVAQVAAGREVIKRGECALSWSIRADGFEKDIELYVVFDGTNRRVDNTQLIPSVFVNKQPVAITTNDGRSVQRTIITADKFISYSPDAMSDGSKRSVQTGSLTDAGARVRDVFDPRVIGISPDSFGHVTIRSVQSLFDHSQDVHSEVSKVSLHGQDVWQIEYLTKRGAVERLWISQTEGDSIVRAEREVQVRGERFLSRSQ